MISKIKLAALTSVIIPVLTFACPDLYSNCQIDGAIVGQIFTSTHYNIAAPECIHDLTKEQLLAECKREFGPEVNRVVYARGADWFFSYTTLVYWTDYREHY